MTMNCGRPRGGSMTVRGEWRSWGSRRQMQPAAWHSMWRRGSNMMVYGSCRKEYFLNGSWQQLQPAAWLSLWRRGSNMTVYGSCRKEYFLNGSWQQLQPAAWLSLWRRGSNMTVYGSCRKEYFLNEAGKSCSRRHGFLCGTAHWCIQPPESRRRVLCGMNGTDP